MGHVTARLNKTASTAANTAKKPKSRMCWKSAAAVNIKLAGNLSLRLLFSPSSINWFSGPAHDLFVRTICGSGWLIPQGKPPATVGGSDRIRPPQTRPPGLQQNCNQTIARVTATAFKIERINRSVSESRQLTRDDQFSPFLRSDELDS
jgi:hypothetical protein